MSFALTIEQVLNRTKTVTRRLGWLNLKAGDEIRAVKKCMGLRPGEKVEPLAVLRVVSARREPLRKMTDDLDYGFAECIREGFGTHQAYRWPSEFVRMFCDTHKGCVPDADVTRIEFEHVSANVGGDTPRAKPGGCV